MASPAVTYTFSNATTADSGQVNTNFSDLIAGMTDGTKDFSIAALTLAGALTANGNVTLGNASGDDVTLTGSLAASIPIKTNNSFDIGSATLGLRKLFLGNGGVGATCSIVSASHATTREYTIPDCSAAASFVMTQADQTIAGNKTFSGNVVAAEFTTASGSGTGTGSDVEIFTAATYSLYLMTGYNQASGDIRVVWITRAGSSASVTSIIAGSGGIVFNVSGASVYVAAGSGNAYVWSAVKLGT